MTSRVLLETSQEYARGEMLANVKPQHDPEPVACFLTTRGFLALPFPGFVLNSGPMKDALAHMIAGLVREHKARAVAFLAPMWVKEMCVTDKKEFEHLVRTPIRQQPSLEHDPDKIEAVGCWIYDRNGEQFHFAKLKRHSHRHPTLSGEWRTMPPLKESRFAEAIMPAFAENN